MRRLELLLELSNIILDVHDQTKALDNITSYLSKATESDVCSIYLLNNAKDTLILSATHGLSQSAVGKVSMQINEGLAGLTYRNNKYTFIRNASTHSSYCYFSGINEEPYNTFIGLPLKSRQHSFGIIVFQFKKNKRDTKILKTLLQAAAAQVSGLILKHYLFRDKSVYYHEFSEGEIQIDGLPLSGGIAIGEPVMVISKFIESNEAVIDSETELEELREAFDFTKMDLQRLIKDLEEAGQTMGTEIFETHLLMLDDSTFLNDIERHITELKKSAAFSVRHVADKLINKFKSFKDSYLRERAGDIDDIANRLLAHLGAFSRDFELKDNSILLADRLTPGETASLNLDKVCAFITEKDGVTSHTAILAKSRQIPAVSGVKKLYQAMEFAKMVIVDGDAGKVIFNPEPETLTLYEGKKKLQKPIHLQEPNSPDVFLKSGEKIDFFSNISSVLDAEKARGLNACGIGLVRTEIFYLQSNGRFSYDKQMSIYREIMKNFPEKPVIFRLLDIGSDKKSVMEETEDNPALGHRGVRLLLNRRELLDDQLRALLETYKSYPNLKIMVPFVANIKEFNDIRIIIQEIADTYKTGMPEVGVMVEIPSIVNLMEKIADICDFFSVGTNDLFQYYFAVDRSNPMVSSLYDPMCASFIDLLEAIFKKANRAGRPIEICGEIAAERTILQTLIKIGYRQFSVNPYVINDLRKYLNSIDI